MIPVKELHEERIIDPIAKLELVRNIVKEVETAIQGTDFDSLETKQKILVLKKAIDSLVFAIEWEEK